METPYLWYLLISTGLAISIFFYRKHVKAAGLFLGVSTLILGGTGVVSFYLGADVELFQALWIAWGFSLVGTLYLGLRTRNAWLFLAFPIFLLFQALVPSLSLFVLFAALTLLMGVLDAYDFSRLDVTSCMKKADKPFRSFLTPFSQLEKLVKRLPSQPRSRPILFSTYLLPTTLLVGLSILAYEAAGGVILVGLTVALICTVYLSIARQECAKGFARISALPKPSSAASGP